MAEDDPVDADFLEHRDRDLAGEGAVVVLVAVLGGDDEVLRGQGLDGLEADEGRGDADVDPLGNRVGDHFPAALGEFLRLGGGLVHLPVAEQ